MGDSQSSNKIVDPDKGESDDEESLEIDDEDEWKELEELKSEFKPLAKSMDDECVAVRVHV